VSRLVQFYWIDVSGDRMTSVWCWLGRGDVQGQRTPTELTSFAFEFTKTGSPTWSNASASNPPASAR
jgi:hypothetical protein